MTNLTDENQNWQSWFTHAHYNDPLLSIYRGNPLIEALPPILTQREVYDHLENYPQLDPTERDLPARLRFHLIEHLVSFFEPLPRHSELEQRISRVIRRGYIGRNPIQTGHYQKLESQRKKLSSEITNSGPQVYLPAMANGFTLLGISGIGKSTTFLRILSSYPQIIIHSEYDGQPFNLIQIPWLLLECPHDGSIKGICQQFFREVDRIAGTNYYRLYVPAKVNVDKLMISMIIVAQIHEIGLLVIDELQNLQDANVGGKGKMLNFFVHLSNTIRVPIALIGTYKAYSLLIDEFRQARRCIGQGDPLWNRLEPDEEWDSFLEALWEFQYVQKPQPLTSELSEILYYHTQGIIDFAVKIFLLAQIRAIESGHEKITADIIHTVAKEALIFAQEALNILRTYDFKKQEDIEKLSLLKKLEDIKPINIDHYINQAVSRQRTEEAKKHRETKKSWGEQKSPQVSGLISEPGDLRTLAGNEDGNAYQALLDNNVIPSVDDLPD